MMTWLILCFFFCFVRLALLLASSAIPAFFLSLPHLRARLSGGGFGLESGFSYRAGLADPAPLPDECPAVEQGPGDGDVVES